ncbi:MAG: hydroxyacid dehydrogenase [Promethearchaeota archaeon]|nr:MAG: hydroxyacid dehydrogenase [Candidatus Lokiarchaeota archaeon]
MKPKVLIMKPKVLILDGVHPNCAAMLRDAELDVEVIDTLPLEELKSRIKTIHAIIVRSKTKITQELIDSAPNLRLIARAGVGLDTIDVEYAKQKNLIVLNAEEAPSVTVAELVMGFIITLLRNISVADHLMKEGKWAKSRLRGLELRGKTIGIIGAGRIGIEVLKRSSAFLMNPIVFDISKEQLQKAQELGAQIEPDLDALLKKADIITIHIPLTPKTKNLINADKFNLMKDGAFIINAARGGIIDEKAMYQALRDGKLGGAGLDCYEAEPIPNSDLINLPNVVCTPHIGASTEETQNTIAYIIAKKVIENLK